MESLEVTGKTVNEAIAKALSLLGKTRDEVEISILTEGSRGIFGIGSEDARIFVSPIDVPVEEEEPIVPISEEVDLLDEDGRGAKPSAEEVGAVAQEIVENLLDGMGIDADVEVSPPSQDALDGGFSAHLNILGDDLGILIGRRGDTLGSLQFITNMILGRQLRRWAKVQIDVENYRARREDTLRQLAQRMAMRVQETGLPLTLEAMPPNERRIIHLVLSNYPNISTQSQGEGDQRRVVISPRR